MYIYYIFLDISIYYIVTGTKQSVNLSTIPMQTEQKSHDTNNGAGNVYSIQWVYCNNIDNVICLHGIHDYSNKD